MKAPDKIYVAESLIKTPYGNEWSPTPYISRESTEYIRKDALLGWINETRAIPHENAITRDLAFQEVVNKLTEI